MTSNNFRRLNKDEVILPSGLTIEQVEEQSRQKGEEIYINAFAAGHPRYYKDERCVGKEMIRANADGSEDLVRFEWPSRDEIVIKSLQPAGNGKFAYLLKDDRFIALKKKSQ